MNPQDVKAMATEVAQRKPVKKAVKVTKDHIDLDGGMMVAPIDVKSTDDALKVTLLMIMKYTSDVFQSVIEIVGEKCKMKPEEILTAIHNHPKWTSTMENPFVHDLVKEIHENAVEIRAPPEEKKKRAPRKPKAAHAVVPVPAPVVPAAAPAEPVFDVSNFMCPACGHGSGADHRMCICRAYNYSVKAWENACATNTKISKKKKPVVIADEEEVCLD